MLEKHIVISNATGLHARPAAKLVEICGPFKSSVTITTPGKTINAKSIMSVLTGGVSTGTEITLCVEGEDEAQAFEVIGEYLTNLPD